MESLPQIGQLNFQLLDDYYHDHQYAEVVHVREDLDELTKNASEIERKREELEEKLILAGEPLGKVEDNDEKVGALDDLKNDALRPVHDNSIQATAPEKQHPKKKGILQ